MLRLPPGSVVGTGALAALSGLSYLNGPATATVKKLIANALGSSKFQVLTRVNCCFLDLHAMSIWAGFDRHVFKTAENASKKGQKLRNVGSGTSALSG